MESYIDDGSSSKSYDHMSIAKCICKCLAHIGFGGHIKMGQSIGITLVWSHTGSETEEKQNDVISMKIYRKNEDVLLQVIHALFWSQSYICTFVYLKVIN